MAAKQTKAKKGIKKEFFSVSAPLITTKISLYATEKNDVVGKIVRIDLTKALRGKSLELNLRVKNVGDDLIGEPERIELAKSYILKVMRKGIDYVEDSFTVECRDCFATIKPFLLTRKRVSRPILRALRNETKEFLLSQLKIKSAQEIFSDIISNKLQKQLSLKLKKVYPLALCEIRVFEIKTKKDNYKELTLNDISNKETEETPREKAVPKKEESESAVIDDSAEETAD